MAFMPDALRLVLEAKSAVLADLDLASREPERLLVLSDLTGTMQVYELTAPGGLIPLSALADPVATAHYVPGRREAVLEVDSGGNERYQLYRIDLEAAAKSPVTATSELVALTADPRHGHRFAGISPDGASLAYLSNRANGVDFDLWLCDLDSLDHRLLYESGAYCRPGSGFSPGGRHVSVLRPGLRPLDVDLVLVDVGNGGHRFILVHPEEAAVVGPPAWEDEHHFFVPCNVGRDLAAVVSFDLASGSTTTLAGTGERFDAAPVTSPDGSTLLIVENRDVPAHCGATTQRPGPPATRSSSLRKESSPPMRSSSTSSRCRSCRPTAPVSTTRSQRHGSLRTSGYMTSRAEAAVA